MTAKSAGQDRLYFRQLLAGRDFAPEQMLARQMLNYAYAIGDRESGSAVLVDAAYAPEELLTLLDRDGMTPVGAFVTHYHADHAGGSFDDETIAGVAALLAAVDIPIYVQRSEVAWVSRSTGVEESALSGIEPGEIVTVGEIPVVCLHTPGHTPGSQCLLVGDRLLTGDTLFLYGCGRTDLPGGDPDALYDSLVHRLAPLADRTSIFVGHAYDREPTATLGALRQLNPVLAPLSQDAWTARFS